MKLFTYLIIFITALLAVSGWSKNDHASSEDISPEIIMLKIKMSGVTSTVRHYYKNDELWNHIIKNVSAGNKDWLIAAKELLNGTDAAETENLVAAVGDALSINPYNVLTIFGSNRLELICQGPDVDSPKYSNKQSALKELTKRIQKLRQIKAASLISTRNKCIDSLKKSRPGIEHFFIG